MDVLQGVQKEVIRLGTESCRLSPSGKPSWAVGRSFCRLFGANLDLFPWGLLWCRGGQLSTSSYWRDTSSWFLSYWRVNAFLLPISVSFASVRPSAVSSEKCGRKEWVFRRLFAKVHSVRGRIWFWCWSLWPGEVDVFVSRLTWSLLTVPQGFIVCFWTSSIGL